jgi:hypothetical protein
MGRRAAKLDRAVRLLEQQIPTGTNAMEAFEVRGELRKPVESQFQGDGLDGRASPDAFSGLLRSEFIQPGVRVDMRLDEKVPTQRALGDSYRFGQGGNPIVRLGREFFPIPHARLTTLHTNE